MKVITAYAALEILGHDYKFKTNIFYDGVIEEGGVLEGDIIIEGRGDPSLDYQDLHNIARLIKLKGIQEVNGRLLYKDNYFMATSQISIDQPASVYNPGVSALVLKNSNFAVEFDYKRELFTVPRLDYLDFTVTRESPNPQYLGDKAWSLNRATHWLPIKDTSYFVTEILRQTLKNNGIEVENIGVASDFSRMRLLFSYEGENFINVVRDNLQFSQNLISEVLLLHMAKKLKCKVNDLTDATRCLQNWYAKKYPALKWQGLNWHNGSGLSSSTRLTARHLLTVLKALDKKRYGDQFGTSLLAVSGVQGTLLKRFREHALDIWGKTGTMYFISGVTGFLYDEDTRYAFVIMVNDQKARAHIDSIQGKNEHYGAYLKAIKQAKEWKKDASDYQDRLIEKWLSDEGDEEL